MYSRHKTTAANAGARCQRSDIAYLGIKRISYYAQNSRIKQKFLYDIIGTEDELEKKNESIYALYLLNYYSRSLSLKSVTIHLPQCAQSI